MRFEPHKWLMHQPLGVLLLHTGLLLLLLLGGAGAVQSPPGMSRHSLIRHGSPLPHASLTPGTALLRALTQAPLPPVVEVEEKLIGWKGETYGLDDAHLVGGCAPKGIGQQGTPHHHPGRGP